MGKTKAPCENVDLRLACFMDAYRQAGYKPKHLVEIASRLPGGKEAIVNKAFWLTVS